MRKRKFVFLIIFAVFIISGCKSGMLTAVKGSVLYVTANPDSIPLGGSSVITVTGYKPSGTLLPDGTVIMFSTDLGSIEDRTEIKNGFAKVVFKSNDGRSGTAKIIVTSGLADKVEVEIKVGLANLSFISLSVNPQNLGCDGGTATITAKAYDKNMSPLKNIPMVFSTDSGLLKSGGSAVYTDEKGVAEDFLTTSEDSVVTVMSGSISNSIKIYVRDNKKPSADFVYSPENPSIDQKIFFNAEASDDEDGYIVSYVWDFGDGSSERGKKVSHKYDTAGTYEVLLLVYDNDRAKNSKSVRITVTD